nr:histidinol-phosphatase HisJ family protein [uncultured Anaerobutyricum sp.]
MLADYHVHTEFSNDSIYPMEEVVKDAISLGIKDICFTDHVDYGPYRDWDDPRGIQYRPGDEGEPEQVALTNVDYKKYFSMIEKMREKYREKIAIKAGLEFGVQTHTIPEYEKLFRSYPFDFIILSIHQAGDQEFWTNEYQSGRTQQEYNEGYYKELLSVVQNYHSYSVLGHMDLIVRYDSYGIYPFEKLKPLLTEILKTVIADGKGIEVNTSNHRYGLSDMTPSRDILKLYKELGGTIITIGSDSHKKEHLGAYIDWAKEELRKLGYTQFCTFEKMQPIFHEL